MNPLILKMDKARESQVILDGKTFTIRRPKENQALRNIVELDDRGNITGFSLKKTDDLEGLVVGWDGITEMDLIPGGTADPVAFEFELFKAWVEDNNEVLQALLKAIIESYLAYLKSKEVALEKPSPGLSDKTSPSPKTNPQAI